MSLKDDILDGVAWKTVARVFGQVVYFGFNVLLARLLTPEAFGVFGMILIFTGFAKTFGRMGFGAALIQRKEITEAHRSSVFWLNIGIGLLLGGIIASLAPAIAWFFDEPSLLYLTPVVALNFPLFSLVIVQRSIMNRDMDFRALAIVETTGITLSGALGVWMAFADYGVWSLVGKTLSATAIEAAVLWMISNWRPRWMFDLEAVKELFNFSFHTFGFEAYNYWAGKGDDLLVGRFIGAAALGVYTRAYSTMLLPVHQITNVLTKVMFPALSKIQGEVERVRDLYLRAVRAIGLVEIPLMMILFVVADALVPALFGSHWNEVIPVLRILCVAGIILPIASTVGWIFKSQGRADWQFRWGLFGTTVTLGANVLGVLYGTIEAVALSYVIAKCVLVPGSYYFAGKLIDMKFWEPAVAVREVFMCSLLAASGSWLLDWYAASAWSMWPQLGAEVAVGVAIYVALVVGLRLDAYVDLRDQLVHKFPSLGSN